MGVQDPAIRRYGDVECPTQFPSHRFEFGRLPQSLDHRVRATIVEDAALCAALSGFADVAVDEEYATVRSQSRGDLRPERGQPFIGDMREPVGEEAYVEPATGGLQVKMSSWM